MTVFITRSFRSHVKNNSEMDKQLNCNNRGSKHPALRFTIKTSYLLPTCVNYTMSNCNNNIL